MNKPSTRREFQLSWGNMEAKDWKRQNNVIITVSEGREKGKKGGWKIETEVHSKERESSFWLLFSKFKEA